MRTAAMLGDISRSLFRAPVTRLYPFERVEAPARLRGALQFDATRCTGCRICVRDCPAAAVELVVLDKKARRFVLRFHVDRCTFCAQCVASCGFGSLSMAHDRWELAALDRQGFVVTHGREEDVARVRAGEGS